MNETNGIFNLGTIFALKRDGDNFVVEFETDHFSIFAVTVAEKVTTEEPPKEVVNNPQENKLDEKTQPKKLPVPT